LSNINIVVAGTKINYYKPNIFSWFTILTSIYYWRKQD